MTEINENNEIIVVYKDVEIVYDEERNRWRFDLDGRERSCESLANAKKAIDTPPKVAKAKKFEPFAAWLKDCSSHFKVVKVISMAEGFRGDVWVMADGRRVKEMLNHLFVHNEANSERIAQIKKLLEELGALHKRQIAITKTLEPLGISHFPSDKESKEPK